jgi:trehalose synthase
MLPKVQTPVKKIEDYREYISQKQYEEIKKKAERLKGLKVNMVNSTPRGGGVAEILKSLVPLMKGIGLKANWYTIPAREDFFKITKEMHNALQGKMYDFPFSARKRYIQHMARTATIMKDMEADVWVVHDPQPAGVIQYLPHFHPSVCRLHIDLSSPNQDVWEFVAGFLEMYDKVVVSSKEFVRPEVEKEAVVFPPAIDPLMSKNQPMDEKYCLEVAKSLGIDTKKPLVTQVSRFDPWKDPLGVVKAYKLAKKEIPNLQLAMAGLFLAQDDPEGLKVYKKVKAEVGNDPDAFLFSDPNVLGGLKVDTFVNALQVASDVVLQKSVKEGFGLTVTEAMWKGKAVIGGKAGGIKMQIKDGENGFVAATPEETAQKIVKLIRNPDMARRIGKRARESVKKNFLMPRLLNDYLDLFEYLTTHHANNKRSNGSQEVMEMFSPYKK